MCSDINKLDRNNSINPEVYGDRTNPINHQEEIHHDTGATPKSPQTAHEDKKTHEYATVQISKQNKITHDSSKSIVVRSFSPVAGDDKNPVLTRKFAKMRAEMVESEIRSERQNKHRAEVWQELKKAFHNRLDQLNIERQNSKK
jgi:hypothetical protein